MIACIESTTKEGSSDGKAQSTESPETPEEPAQQARSRGPALNRVELIGRLTADPRVHVSPEGKWVTTLRLATNEREEPEFHTAVAFGSLADFIGQYLRKGRLVFIEGRLRTRQWSDGGHPHWTTEIAASQLQVLDRRPDEEA